MKLHRIWSVVLCAALGLCGCAGAITDERLASDTAGVFGVSPSDVTISNRKSDGETIYYDARIRSGKSYACSRKGQQTGIDLIFFSSTNEELSVECASQNSR
jgi:hypothetical protein